MQSNNVNYWKETFRVSRNLLHSKTSEWVSKRTSWYEYQEISLRILKIWKENDGHRSHQNGYTKENAGADGP